MTRSLMFTLCLAACGADPSPSTSAPAADEPTEVLAARAVADTAVPEDSPMPEAVEVALAEPEPGAEPAPAPVEGTTWEVRHGESLAHYARWAELPVEAIADASGLSLEQPVAVGATVRVPGDDVMRAKVESARDAHHRRRAHGYLANRGGSQGTEFYVVRTGDTAWTVARDEVGVPVWLLETYNPAVDLDRLRPGQQLMVPVIADTVADATPSTTEAP